jgi:hypothetical protein
MAIICEERTDNGSCLIFLQIRRVLWKISLTRNGFLSQIAALHAKNMQIKLGNYSELLQFSVKPCVH